MPPVAWSPSYRPAAAQLFMLNERYQSVHRVNQKCYAIGYIQHPLRSIVEYSETGSQQGEIIAHYFLIGPGNNNFEICSLREYFGFQYSLGEPKGMCPSVKKCIMLSKPFGLEIPCSRETLTCEQFNFYILLSTLMELRSRNQILLLCHTRDALAESPLCIRPAVFHALR